MLNDNTYVIALQMVEFASCHTINLFYSIVGRFIVLGLGYHVFVECTFRARNH